MAIDLTVSNKTKLLGEAKKEIRRRCKAFSEEFPILYEFMLPYINYPNSRRLGPTRTAYMYSVFKASGFVFADTTPEDLGRDPETFFDLADTVVREFHKDRTYAMGSIMLFYQFLQKEKRISPSFLDGNRSPYSLLAKQTFMQYMYRDYEKRDDMFFLRHGRQRFNTKFYVVPCQNHYLRDLLIEAIIKWPTAWIQHGQSRLDLITEAEKWFEGTTDKVQSWEHFDAKMLDTARRHIMRIYEGEWRKDAMRFLFFFYRGLLLAHPEHDFFKGSYYYCSELVLNKHLPSHLASGYEIAFYGQRQPFLQGHGTIFIVYDADRLGASYRKTEIRRYDLSMITVESHWNALANFILEQDRDKIIECRYFLQWFENRKKTTGEDPNTITKVDMDAYRLHIAEKRENGGSRNACICQVTKIIRWMSDGRFLRVAPDALKDFGYFFVNSTPAPSPLLREEIAKLLEMLEIMGREQPRFLLIGILIQLMLNIEIRAGSILTLRLWDIKYYDDGSSKILVRAKASGVDKTPYYLTKESTDLVRRAIELTEDVRRRCPASSIRSHVFIYEGKEGAGDSPFSAMNLQRFDLDLKEAGSRIGRKDLNSGMLRDTMFTMLNLHMIKERVPNYKKSALTHHASLRSIRSYAVVTVTDILCNTPKLVIGKINK